MSKIKLYTMAEMAEMENVTSDAIKQRINVRGLKPYAIQNKFHLFTESQKDLIMEKRKETIVCIQETQIIESKINKKSAVYGTHRRYESNR
jgi:predicted DNA-binding protein YlxM (UPF0122 family)